MTDKDDLLYEAWGIIANASDWNNNPEWRQAAEHWRDKMARVFG